MARASGSRFQALLKKQSAYGIPATGNFMKMPITSFGLGVSQDLIDDPVLGFGRDPLEPLLGPINVDGDIGIPLDTRYLGFWLTGLFSLPTSAQRKAEGSIVFTANPTAGQTITIAGTVFTFVAGASAGNSIGIKASVSQTIDEIVTVLNASGVAAVMAATYSHPAGTQFLKIQHDTVGTTGNSFTIAATAGTASAATLQGGGYEHVFHSGADQLPAYSIEGGMPEIPNYELFESCVFNSIAFDFQRSGAAKATINVIAQGRQPPLTASQGGVAQELAFSRISQFQGSIRSGGVRVANLTSGSFTFSNNLDKIETIRDDGKIDGADPGISSFTGSVGARLTGDGLITAANNRQKVDLEFAYILSAASWIKFTATQVTLSIPRTPVEGPGGIQVSLDFQASRDQALGRMLTVSLLNDLDGTVYQ